MPILHCPTCDRRFEQASSSAIPFCSARCRLVDLGRWLDERNSVPHDPPPDEEGEIPEQ
ncbi:MAG: DNA gyrase inhibitor YacG [Patescibacteria group bacterium]|nr:DNA gyrase inhibitor YacG [Patescibacteria group bacterium]